MKRRTVWEEEQVLQKAEAHRPATLKDGHTIEIAANAGGVDDAHLALQLGAEGVGLLRTEFFFLDRTSAPTEAEQIAALRPVGAAMGMRPVVVRTLDAGGDKELPYLCLPHEANPFMGVRALRISLRQPELFRTQLRAILQAGLGHDFRLLFPMVGELSELEQALKEVEAAHASLVTEGIPHLWPIQSGIMIEIPSAALLADTLAERADFFSIGTNDLTQYTLAADRGNPGLTAFQDALHPAVLTLVAQVVRAAHLRGKSVAVCGEAGGDPHAALIFAGLGVDELSMSPRMIPKIKAILRTVSQNDLKRLAERALRHSGAAEVRAEVARFVEMGLE